MSNQKKYKSTEIAVQEAYCGESNAQEHRKVGIAVEENREYGICESCDNWNACPQR